MTKAIMVRFSDAEASQIEEFVKNGMNRSMADLIRKATVIYIETKLTKRAVSV